MPTAYDFENSIVNSLRVTDPQLDTSLGTAIRKMISAVAMEIGNYVTDQDVTSTLYSLESVSGAELDYLVGQFGFARQMAKAARGSVTIRRDNADSRLEVPYGMQFYKPETSTSGQVVYQTTAYAVLEEGVTDATIAVVAVNPGVAGNVAANTITRTNGFTGYISVTNELPLVGGRDEEQDDALRRRFLDTVFRNVSGTKDQYLGLSLANANVSRANVIGAMTRYIEVAQVEKRGASDLFASLESTRLNKNVEDVPDNRRVWVKMVDTQKELQLGEFEFDLNVGAEKEATVTFGNPSKTELVGPVVRGGSIRLSEKYISNLALSKGNVLVPSSQYSLDAESGVITIRANASAVSDGDVLNAEYRYSPVSEGDFVQIEFDYRSTLLRDGTGVCEVFVDGNVPQKVSDIEYLDLSKTVTSANRSRWVRANGEMPSVGAVYVPLSYTPMIESTGSVNVGTSIILRDREFTDASGGSHGPHFHVLYDASESYGSRDAVDAIELVGSIQTIDGVRKFRFTNDQNYALEDDTPMNIPYYYNDVVDTVQRLVDGQSTITADALVHEVKRRQVGIYLTVMYTQYPHSGVSDAAENAIMTWSSNRQIGQSVQISDIETVVANVYGIDNVRLATSADAGGKVCEDVHELNSDVHPQAFGIIECERDGETFVAQHTRDFMLADNEVLEIKFVRFYDRAQRQW